MPKKRYLEEDKKNNDVQSARGRLKGALQDVFTLSEDEDNEDVNETDEDYRSVAIKKPYAHGNRGRPPKRFKRNENNDLSGHRSYFMKLFDRSVDLARFDEETPLYPICRAWMANKPRYQKVIKHPSSPEHKHVDIEELKNMIDCGSVTNITHMPIPEIDDEKPISRVPSPLPCQINQNKDEINIDYDLDNPSSSKEDLMKDHLKRWNNIKQKWHQQTIKFESKYELNVNLLKCLYKQ